MSCNEPQIYLMPLTCSQLLQLLTHLLPQCHFLLAVSQAINCRTHEVPQLYLHNWRHGRRDLLLDASEHAVRLMCGCPSPSLVPQLGDQPNCVILFAMLLLSLQPKHGCFDDSGKGKQQSHRVVAVTPWYILGYVNNARNARGFQEVSDYSVGSAPTVLVLKSCAIFIYTLLVSLPLQLCSLAAYL